MDYISVKIWAEKHGVSERTARNYCAMGKIPGAYLVGKTWNIYKAQNEADILG
jgi:predicted site-specific integrase-resolvase